MDTFAFTSKLACRSDKDCDGKLRITCKPTNAGNVPGLPKVIEDKMKPWTPVIVRCDACRKIHVFTNKRNEIIIYERVFN